MVIPGTDSDGVAWTSHAPLTINDLNAVAWTATRIVAVGNNGAVVTSDCVPTSCAAPIITANPYGATVTAGQSVTLSVAATGTAPFLYQWYVGQTGDTSMLVGTNAATFTASAIGVSRPYWVRVVNACGHADSATATVVVTGRVRRHLRAAT